jgi:hypothetical protein
MLSATDLALAAVVGFGLSTAVANLAVENKRKEALEKGNVNIIVQVARDRAANLAPEPQASPNSFPWMKDTAMGKAQLPTQTQTDVLVPTMALMHEFDNSATSLASAATTDADIAATEEQAVGADDDEAAFAMPSEREFSEYDA